MPAPEPREVVQRWFTDFARRRDDFDSLVAADIVNHAAPPALQQGAAAFRRIIDTVIAATGPDGGYHIEHLVAEGDLVMCFTHWHGTHSAAFGGIAATGRPFVVAQAHLFRVLDGKLVEHWAIRDELSFLRQVGAQ